jgi:hypothetical protein
VISPGRGRRIIPADDHPLLGMAADMKVLRITGKVARRFRRTRRGQRIRL